MLLTVYVDDFLLSGPESRHERFWEELGKNVDIEDVGPLDRFLGRYSFPVNVDGMKHLAFGMHDYARSCCELYTSLPGAKPLKYAASPFLPEGSLITEDDAERGELSSNACKVLMKTLWLGRLARPDIVRAITGLARKVTRWSLNDDRQLYRLMCYIHSTIDYTLTGTVNDPPEDLWLELFVDADFAGDREDALSTNGGWLVLCGPNSYFPLTWVSKKQSSVSRSTSEAEIVALAHSLFLEALPMCALWDLILDRTVELTIHEDNKAAILIAEAGFSSKLRHISRTHKVNISSIRDEVVKEEVSLQHISTDKQAADIFTKALEVQKWGAALNMLGVHPYRPGLWVDT